MFIELVLVPGLCTSLPASTHQISMYITNENSSKQLKSTILWNIQTCRKMHSKGRLLIPSIKWVPRIVDHKHIKLNNLDLKEIQRYKQFYNIGLSSRFSQTMLESG